jgi:hypothetical protein
MARSVEHMNKIDEYRTRYEQMSKKPMTQDFFDNRTTHLPTWEYLDFVESALYLLEKKNIELKNKH